LVSVGLPVRDGGAALDLALTALRQQSHSELEIIVCENGSQDDSLRVALAHAAQDSRVRVVPADPPVDAVSNFNRCLGMARGAFFMWAAHDDLFEPEFIGACLEALSATGALACVTDSMIIDGEGREVAARRVDDRLASTRARDRLRAHARAQDWLEVYALYRRSVLVHDGLALQSVPGPDVLFTWRLLQRGPLAVVHRPLFRYRRVAPSYKSALEMFGSTVTKGGRSSPHALNARLWWALWRGADSPRTRRVARLELLGALLTRAWLRRFRDDMRAELTLAGRR